MEDLNTYLEQVDFLPNGMIIYDLKKRRVKPKPTLRRRKSQLAEILYIEKGKRTY